MYVLVFVYVVGLVYYVIVIGSVCFSVMGVFTLGLFICSCYVVIV